MNAKALHRVMLGASINKHSRSIGECITLGEALDRCRASDVRQIAWELGKVGIRVTPCALLAMALSRAVVRQVAEQYRCQEQLEQAKKLVPRTGDKQSA